MLRADYGNDGGSALLNGVYLHQVKMNRYAYF